MRIASERVFALFKKIELIIYQVLILRLVFSLSRLSML